MSFRKRINWHYSSVSRRARTHCKSIWVLFLNIQVHFIRIFLSFWLYMVSRDGFLLNQVKRGSGWVASKWMKMLTINFMDSTLSRRAFYYQTRYSIPPWVCDIQVWDEPSVKHFLQNERTPSHCETFARNSICTKNPLKIISFQLWHQILQHSTRVDTNWEWF